jgi:WD40 repeat protein
MCRGGRLWLSVFALLAVTANFTSISSAQVNEPSTEPILRIEAGQHIGSIYRIDTDAEIRFVVTASDDKTARVWSLPDGKLLRVLRVPIEDSNQVNSGMIYSVASSPDGNTVAVGGWTVDPHHDIFLFDRESGSLKQRFGDLPNVIHHLAYSPDGKRLAATLGGANGVRVFDATNGYNLLPSDTKYQDASHAAQFDSAGRLITASDDGFVRLYAPGQYAIPKARFDSKGRRPWSAVFSPDGSRIAVGYNNVADVDVLSSDNMKLVFKPNLAGISGAVAAVGWSPVGNFLFAGGMWSVNDVRPVRRWSNGGRGPFIDIPAASQTIVEILGLKDQSMLFAHVDGFGLISTDGKATQLQKPSFLDTSGGGDLLQITRDGSAVQLGAFAQKRTYRFELTRRVVDIDPAIDAKMISPLRNLKQIKVTNWDQSITPSVNGTPIKLGHNERSLSFAIVPGTRHFLLGADYSLRLIDQNGKNVWSKMAATGGAHHVNVSSDGKLGVAAYDDGTIRWHRLSDGGELLALFIHPDGQRWILWTPQGYYDASLGADELIGWHVNRGRDQAPDFYPVSQFRSRFYRPDVINRVLQTLDVEEAVRKADEAAKRPSTRAVSVSSLLTPVIEISDPKSPAVLDRPELKLVYSVRLPSPDETLNVEAVVDGVKVKADNYSLVSSGSVRAGILTLTIPRRDSKVSAIAYNQNGASEPAAIDVRWGGPGTEPKLTLYVLAIGVSDYKDEHFRLRFPAKDAEDFVAAAKAQEGKAGLYEKVIVRVLRNSEATKNNILLELDRIRRAVTNTNDVAMIFIAGHGKTGDSGDRPYRFLPYDYDADQEIVTTIRDTDFKDFLTEIGGKKILFLDTCFAGAFQSGIRDIGTQQADVDKFANELRTAENGIVVFTSSTGRGLSREDEKWNNGAFTKALVEGLRGAAAQPQARVVTINGLSLYVSRQVRDLTGGNQKPMMAMPKTVEDYPISMRLQ